MLAYKQQPAIERRFEQMKTDFVVAPVYLKETSRIQALLCVYFFVLLVESLLERELRRAMAAKEIEGLPLYPEGRACRRPTARKVIDLFEDVQRHTLVAGKEPPVEFTTELTRLQRRILRFAGDGGRLPTLSRRWMDIRRNCGRDVRKVGSSTPGEWYPRVHPSPTSIK